MEQNAISLARVDYIESIEAWRKRTGAVRDLNETHVTFSGLLLYFPERVILRI